MTFTGRRVTGGKLDVFGKRYQEAKGVCRNQKLIPMTISSMATVLDPIPNLSPRKPWPKQPYIM